MLWGCFWIDGAIFCQILSDNQLLSTRRLKWFVDGFSNRVMTQNIQGTAKEAYNGHGVASASLQKES